MNQIQTILLNRLLSGDKKLRALFEHYVENMGHSKKESRTIVENILCEDKTLLKEDSLANMAKYDGKQL